MVKTFGVVRLNARRIDDLEHRQGEHPGTLRIVDAQAAVEIYDGDHVFTERQIFTEMTRGRQRIIEPCGRRRGHRVIKDRFGPQEIPRAVGRRQVGPMERQEAQWMLPQHTLTCIAG